MTTERSQLTIHGAMQPAYEDILTDEACAFLVELVRTFRPQLKSLLATRQQVQARYDAGTLPDFLPETAAIRAADWQVAAIPADLQDRRVEITGP
ncbi:MAG: malate synthase A, partial [Gammaproteobacteria bacterium]|nr:malate synthase A [Gammaproteobacteria bacterium]